jgi:hypothetical protein
VEGQRPRIEDEERGRQIGKGRTGKVGILFLPSARTISLILLIAIFDIGRSFLNLYGPYNSKEEEQPALSFVPHRRVTGRGSSGRSCLP